VADKFEMPNGRVVIATSDAQGRRLEAQGGKRLPNRGEYTEPTNAQLARFLVVYARDIFPGAENLKLSPPILESLMSTNPVFRETALRHHRAFQDKIVELTEKMAKGELQCEFIRPNGKRCPNYNEPGHMYCGLHKSEED
jgi:hypothetical protein